MRRYPLYTAAFAALAAVAHADVYKVVDPQGHVEYTDRWVPGAEHIKGDHLRGRDTPDEEPQAKKPAADPKSKAEQSAAQAVQQDVAATREKQCKEAREQYDKMIEARRIFQTEKDGERTYLSDDQADQQRVQARLAMDQACGTAGKQPAPAE